MSAPATNLLGDIPSEVITIKGDVEWETCVPYIAETLYKAVQPLNEDQSVRDSAIGRLLGILTSPIATAPGGAACPIYFDIYMAADDNFQLMKPGPWYANFAPSTTSPAIRGVAKKSSLTSVFGRPFRSIVPITSTFEKNICSPDFVNSVTELCKRYELFEYTTTSPILPLAGVDGWPTASWHRWLVLPFITWRGSSNYKLFSNNISATPATSMSAQFLQSGTVPGMDSLGGTLYHKVNPGSMVEVNMPYYEPLICREVHPTLAEIPTGLAYRFGFSPAGDTVYVLGAAGDDFSLGPMVGPPLIVYTAPPQNTRVRAEVPRRLRGGAPEEPLQAPEQGVLPFKRLTPNK